MIFFFYRPEGSILFMGNKLYTPVQGDTLSKLAIRFYGDSSRELIIRNANGIRNQTDLIIGIPIKIPDIPGIAPINNLNSALGIRPESQDDISIFISDVSLTVFKKVVLKSSIESIADGFEITTVWDSKDQGLRRLFAPFQYNECKIFIGQDQQINGILDSPSFIADNQIATTAILTGRTKTGILIDSSIDTFPLEFNKQTLEQIATNIIIGQFQLDVKFLDDPGPLFETVSAKVGESPFEFLWSLAITRGLLISSDKNGCVIFFRPKISKPVATLIEGENPIIGGEAIYNGTQRFSTFRGLGQRQGVNDLENIERDSALKQVVRPHVFKVMNNSKGDISTRVKWERGRSIGNSMSIQVEVSGWRDFNGKLWEPGSTISLEFPSIGIFNATNFIVKTVQIIGAAAQSRLAFIELSIPEVYTLDDPGAYPWDF